MVMRGIGTMKASLRVLICFLITFSLATDFQAGAGEKKKKYVKSKHGIKALINFSKDRKEMVKGFAQETENYNKAKAALEAGTLGSGDAASSVRKRLGAPSIVVYDEVTGTNDWVYKPGTSDFFTKDEVHLVFDKDGKLMEWGVPED